MKYIYIPIILLLTSCYTENYKVNASDPNLLLVDGYRMSPYGQVLLTEENGLEAVNLKNKSKTSLKLSKVNQFYFESILKLVEGKNFNIYLRTTRHDFPNKKGIKIQFKDGIADALIEDELIQSREFTFKNSNPHFLKILSDGMRTKVLIDCDEILDCRTDLTTTEYIILETEESELIISGLNFIEIYPISSFEF